MHTYIQLIKTPQTAGFLFQNMVHFIYMTSITFITPLVFGFLSGFIIRFIMKFLVPRSVTKRIKTGNKNLGIADRIMRACIGVICIVAALYIPEKQFGLLLIAGFTFFESIFSWCVLYNAVGKNTCPIN